MAKVKIVNGAYGYKPAGAVSVKAITAESGPIEVSNAEAERLVRLGVAVIVDAPAEVAPECPAVPVATAPPADDGCEGCTDIPEEENGAEGQETACLDAEQLKTMTNAQLRELAEDMGLDVSVCKVKADYIDLIAAEEVEIDEEAPPELEAEAPVV